METKLVYVVVSNDNDIYLEQAWVSAYSARHYNPDAHIAFVTDEDTYEGIIGTERKRVMGVVDEIVPVHIDGNLSNMRRSRWIKTNLRNLIDGDFLFIDTDTVVTGDLSGVDLFTCEIGAVQEFHYSEANPNSMVDYQRLRVKNIFGIKTNETTGYFNSGVIYVKDDELTHKFYSRWHLCWKQGCEKGICTDQQSLHKTCDEFKEVVRSISGVYNCLVAISIQYLSTARIVHFYNAKWNDSSLNPFFGKTIYLQLKEKKEIDAELENEILSCRELFSSPSKIIGSNDLEIWFSTSFRFLRWLYVNHRLIYRVQSKLLQMIIEVYCIFLKKVNGVNVIM